MHVIGATGCGKSTFLLNDILQDIARGRGRLRTGSAWRPSRQPPQHGVAVLPRSPMVCVAPGPCHRSECPRTRSGPQSLAPLPNTDPAVLAGAMKQAFSRVWSDEDTHKTPLTTRILRNIFTALAETGRPLADAAQLLDYEDPHRLRLELIANLKNENARQELKRIERRSREPRDLSNSRRTSSAPRTASLNFLPARRFA